MSAYGSDTRGTAVPFFIPFLCADAYLGCRCGFKPRTMERNALMDTVQPKEKLQPVVSPRFVGMMLLALFAVPLAMHLLVSFLM
jgi:hypothetical protein